MHIIGTLQTSLSHSTWKDMKWMRHQSALKDKYSNPNNPWTKAMNWTWKSVLIDCIHVKLLLFLEIYGYPKGLKATVKEIDKFTANYFRKLWLLERSETNSKKNWQISYKLILEIYGYWKGLELTVKKNWQISYNLILEICGYSKCLKPTAKKNWHISCKLILEIYGYWKYLKPVRFSQNHSEAYSELCQTSMMEIPAQIINC